MVLLASFMLIEARSREALMPLRIFRNRSRSGAYLVMLCVGTAMFGMFFFLSLFMQTVWGYRRAEGTGVAYLPMVGVIMLMAGVSAQLVRRDRGQAAAAGYARLIGAGWHASGCPRSTSTAPT